MKKRRTYFAKWRRGVGIHWFVAGLMLLIAMPTFSQQRITVTGTIVDSENEPIVAATIMEKGITTTGAMSDANGRFTISVTNENATLQITYLGMQTLEESLNGRTNIQIVMEEDHLMLDDVVVTALGIKRHSKALGYAVSEVEGDEVTAGRDINIMSALSGKVAGVDIASTTAGPSGSTRITIRGNSQLSGSNLPLYVIDGVPMENTQLGGAGKWGGYDYGDGLGAVSADDVESVTVLKGPSASALYGSRAANGVILITTKSAKKGEGLGVEFSTNVNAVVIGRHFDDYQRVYGQGRDGRLTIEESDARTSTQSAWGAKLDPTLSIPIYNGEIKPYGNVNNNILSFFRTGFTTTNSLALSKAMDKGDFRVSVSDMRNNDIVPGSDMARTTALMRGSAKLGDKLTIEGRVNYTHEKVNNRPALADHPSNVGNAIIGLAPNFDQKWLKSGYKDELGNYNQWNGNDYRLNPYWIINEMQNLSKRDRVMGHIQLRYQILPYLSAQVKAGTDFYKFRVTERTPLSTPRALSGSMMERTTNVFENNFEGMIRFDKTFNDVFHVSAFVGGNIMRYENETFVNNGLGQVDANATSILNYESHTLSFSKYRKEVHSIYGAVNLGYKDYAFIDFTLRNDRSSTLASGNRSYTYPSVSGSFVFSDFFEIDKGAFEFGKIRASWAKVGGDTDPYRLSLSYGLRDITMHGVPLGEVASYAIPAPNLKPTSTYSYEFGLDLRFFKGRLNLDVGYYSQITKDQILNLPVSRASGYNQAVINAGEISNKGIEVSLHGIPVSTGGFEWSSILNFSKNINKVKELHADVSDYVLADARWANAYIYASEGEPYGTIVGKKFKRTDDGEMIFNNGLPTYEDKVSVLGNGNHDFIMGFSNRFSYKGFTLNILLDMKWGADIYSMSAMQAHSNGTSKNTLDGREGWYRSEEERMSQNIDASQWTPTGGFVGKGVMAQKDESGNTVYVPNDVYVNPQSYWNSIYNNTPEPYIYDASYIKLRELTFSYHFPKRLLRKTFIQDLSITVYGRNLWIIHTKVKNVDPESSYNNGNGQGFEYGSLPTRRTFGAGINIKF